MYLNFLRVESFHIFSWFRIYNRGILLLLTLLLGDKVSFKCITNTVITTN